jgi:hypothetical protein
MIRYQIDASSGLVVVKLAGLLTLDEVKAYQSRIATDRDFNADLLPLFDVRKASLSELTPGALRSVAAGIVFHSMRQAYVVADDMQFGMVRMLGAFADLNRPGRELRPFREMKAARAWLLRDLGA